LSATCSIVSPEGRDLAFWVWVRTADTSAPRYCEFEDASGVANDWLPNHVPICGCLEDLSSRANRCWFALPELTLWRELELPLDPGAGRAIYSVLPLRVGVDNIRIEDVGVDGDFSAELADFGKGIKPGKPSSVRVKTWTSGQDVESLLRVRFETGSGPGEAIFRTRLEPFESGQQ
jgi:hypothetical protein